MQINQMMLTYDKRLGKYLDEIAAETINIEKTIGQKSKKRDDIIHQNPHICQRNKEDN